MWRELQLENCCSYFFFFFSVLCCFETNGLVQDFQLQVTIFSWKFKEIIFLFNTIQNFDSLLDALIW